MRPEVKHIDVYPDPATNATGLSVYPWLKSGGFTLVPLDFSSITQGVNRASRIGNKVLLKRLVLKGFITANTVVPGDVNPDVFVRCVFFRRLDDTGFSAGAPGWLSEPASELFSDYVTTGTRVPDNRSVFLFKQDMDFAMASGRYKVLRDRMYILHSNDATVGNPDYRLQTGPGGTITKYFYFNIKLNSNAYYGPNSNSPTKGGIGMYIWCNIPSANTIYPRFNYNARLYFTDV